MAPTFKKTKHTCFFTYLAMSSVFSFPPILFITFREMYSISYTLLGTLVLINFCTQLLVDLIFSFFAKHFNVKIVIRIMPLLTSLGLLVYALVPWLAPKSAYVGFVIGTVIFSIGSGLCEVLLSPLVAAIPSETPDRDMSKLHSLYAYGVVMVVVISSLYLHFVGTANWTYLAIFWALLPIISFALFLTSPIPDVNMSQNHGDSKLGKKNLCFILCIVCIFLGSAAENSMTNWISGFVENVLQIPKVWGDILGLALFAILLGLGRTLYAKFGKNISNILLISMIGATICYLVASLSPNIIVSMIACVLTGLCTSMLWPGTLILMEERFNNPGVTAYALMAAGGDLGGSLAPQLLGIVVDSVSASAWASTLSTKLSLSTEQIGLKAGMLSAAIFPIFGIIVLIVLKSIFKKQDKLKTLKNLE